MQKWVVHLMVCFCTLCLLCGTAMAEIRVSMTPQEDGPNRIVTFSAEASSADVAETAAAVQEILDERFSQSDAFRTFVRVLGRGGESTIYERGSVFSTDRFISILLVWNGQQPSGGRG
ncbi:MAG: hypothetical protein IJ242_17960, partial [Clostridia bacterium]|nr:hypothetical protein [Clostridia bacterium]